MKKFSTKTKAIFIPLVFAILVSTFYWMIINFSMNPAGFEHLKIIDAGEARELIKQNKDNPDFQRPGSSMTDMKTGLKRAIRWKKSSDKYNF